MPFGVTESALAFFSAGSMSSRVATVAAAYVWLSVKYVSIAVWAVRTLLLASESCALARWLRKAGRAIAARMPMIRMTTRSSMSVKPFSS